jgi:hypothetical protein
MPFIMAAEQENHSKAARAFGTKVEERMGLESGGSE